MWTSLTSKLTCGLAVGALAVGLAAGCGSSSSTESGGSSKSSAPKGDAKKRVNIAMFLVATANTHQQASLRGAKDAVAKDGNAKVRVFGANFVPKTQVSQVEAATASGQYDALIINSVDGTVMTPAINKAVAAGIKVICGFSICGPDQQTFKKQLPGVSAQISTDYALVGMGIADALGKGCKGIDPCNTIYLDGTPTLAADVTITKAFNSQIKRYPNIKVVGTGEGLFVAAPSYKAMKDLIQAHPDIHAVASPGDQMIVGARQAIMESKLKDKKIILIGDGASKLASAGIQAGHWYADAILRPYTEGYLETLTAIKAVRGEQVEPLVNSAITEGIPEGYISADTVSKFKPEWDG
jgi:ribose transport system substrate-binding protein